MFLLTSRSRSSGSAASGRNAADVRAGQSANATEVNSGVVWDRRETISSDSQINLEKEAIRRSGLRLMSLLWTDITAAAHQRYIQCSGIEP